MQASPLGYPAPPSGVLSHSNMTPSHHSQPHAPPPLSTLNTHPYGAPPPASHPSSVSTPLSGPPSGMGDQMRMSDPASAGSRTSPSHSSMAALSAQKRAYRQRRKDPSCDACRERKVKCDATDASSCSECSSRSVKCQFTKETNRRMSSMKQVQDLERQLHQAKQQISQLKGMMQDGGSVGGPTASTPTLAIPDGGQMRDRGQLPRASGNFFKVRRNIRNYARGIFKPPIAYRTPGVQHLCPDGGPPLPPPHVAEHLLLQYKKVLHPFQPVLHWATFQNEVDDLYRSGSFRGVRKAWIGVFYGVLACATLVADNRFPDLDALGYVQQAIQHINTLSDDVTIDHARTSLMLSVYFMETNRRSAAWIWLGAAVRTAQESGLHLESHNVTPMVAELRKRTWWSIYNWDRICALELGQSVDGADPDVEVGEPTPIDDDYIKADGFQTLDSGSSSPNGLIALIPVVRIIHQLKKTLKSRVISAASLKIYDDHFQSIMDSYPDPFPIGSSTPLDPVLLHPALSLQVCRFMLYRHNLTPACRLQERQDALGRCLGVAKDTAHYIWRSTPTARTHHARLAIHPPDTANPEWQNKVRFAVPSVLVSHFWRCILILCLTGEYAPALTIIGVLNAVNDQKKINISCGRYLAFFLDLMIQRWQSGRGSDIENDEEMLAYASGDLQGSSFCAWAWNGSDPISGSGESNSPNRMSPPGETFANEAEVIQPVSLLTEEEEQEWGGWHKVAEMVHQLQYLRTAASSNHTQQANYYNPDEHRTAQPPHQQQQQHQHHTPHPYASPTPHLANPHTNPPVDPRLSAQSQTPQPQTIQHQGPSPYPYPSPSALHSQTPSAPPQTNRPLYPPPPATASQPDNRFGTPGTQSPMPAAPNHVGGAGNGNGNGSVAQKSRMSIKDII